MIPRRKIHVMRGESLRAVRGLFGRDNRGSVEIFEKEFGRFIGTEHAFAVSSGRAGMSMLFQALKLEPGSEIIIPAYTLGALTKLIRSLNLVPVAADIEMDTFNISARTVAPRITERTRVIMPAHLFGSPARIDDIVELARGKGIKVIEDCAHSAGASINGRQTGALADAAFFSFETIKPVNTYGGGMVTTSDHEIAARFKEIYDKTVAVAGGSGVPLKKIISAAVERAFLPTPLSFVPLYLLASPRWRERVYKMYRSSQNSVIQQFAYTGFQAELGRSRMSNLEKWISGRERNAAQFKELLPDWLVPQKAADGARVNYYFFVACIQDGRTAADIRLQLLKKGIDAGVEAEIADDCSFGDSANYPGIARVFKSAIHLPLHENMSARTVEHVAGVLRSL